MKGMSDIFDSSRAAIQEDLLVDSLYSVCDQNPVVDKAIIAHGEATVAAYLQRIMCHTNQPLQPRSEFISIMAKQVKELYGDVCATNLRHDLERQPTVLTTNHHGVDYFAQSLQGTLLMSSRLVGDEAPKTIPVLACAGIPVNNLTYPQGVLIYSPGSEAGDRYPVRVPVISNKHRPELTYVTKGINAADVQRAIKRLNQLSKQHAIGNDTAEVAISILEEQYLATHVQSQERYVDQAGLINHDIWKRVETDSQTVPELLYLSIESIASDLIALDVENSDSLLSTLWFDPILRRRLLSNLAGVAGCWSSFLSAEGQTQSNQTGHQALGTHFFWGIDSRQRRIPLRLQSRENGVSLVGSTDDESFEYPFTPASIQENLAAGKLMPSLFSCFAAISLARGVTCLGGYYQASYLPRMAHGIDTVLATSVDFHRMRNDVANVPVTGYLSGMQAFLHHIDGVGLLPAGLHEMVASGGISPKLKDMVRQQTVQNLHMASLLETLPDLGIAPSNPDWWRSFAHANESKLSEHLIVCKK